ncbi:MULTISPECIES: SusC/RagA family TonB-linked outer membrane protein [unclassified Saccharicrinis]|uniref:SusC/RagA family TonB-linked outer membrane protein n=1 Tax=unclassified Saccharicrinis TaxID=2646859 RepID=UPI003D33B81C
MKQKLLFSLMLFLGTQIIFAQGIVIKGTVSGADDGLTIPGVSVVVKGTTNGVTTDFDGMYQINVPGEDAILEYSFVGYKTQTVVVGKKSTIDIVLKSDLVGLDEVVVIGYGVSSKEALTGAVEVVGSESLKMLPSATLENALQGGVTGLMMSNGDGQPGAASSINIRGIGSINASSEPLYVIDGIPVQSHNLSPTDYSNGGISSTVMSTLNPNDVQSITVLKDASATAIYGSRGANGVIIITTKNGGSGKAKINFSAQVGVSDNAYDNINKSLNAAQYKELFIEGWVNTGDYTEATATELFYDYYPADIYNADTNWMDEIYNPGVTQQYSLDASGGNDKIRYFASLGYYDQEGVILGTDFQRYSSRLNLTADLNEKLTITNNITLGHTVSNGSEDRTAWNNPMHNGYMAPPVVPIYDDYGNYFGDHTIVGMDGNNPVGNQLFDERWQKQTRILDNFSASYKITDALTFKTAWSIDYINVNEFKWKNPDWGSFKDVSGRGEEGTANSLNWIGTQTVNYNKIFGENHSFDVLAGYESQKYDMRSLYAVAEGYANSKLKTLANAANPIVSSSSGTGYSFLSAFSRFSYNYKSKYYATASYRRDGSSRFGEDNRWGNFWSVGGSWYLSRENFMKDISWVNNLKLRASYGITGNASIGNFQSLSLYGYDYEYDGTAGSAPSNVGNPELTWETQGTLDLGMDLSVFDRVNTTVTYFRRENTDLLLEKPLSTTTGFSETMQNVGDMLNRGWEFEANAAIIKGEDLTWDLGVNMTFVKNEVTKLDEDIANTAYLHSEGHDYNEFYLIHWAGVNPQTGAAQWYTDETKTTITENRKEASRVHTGYSGTPSCFGGLNTSVSYKGFNLSAQLVFVWDKYLFDNQAKGVESDGQRAPRSTNLYAFENRWTTPGEESELPIFVWGNSSNSNYRYSTRYLYDATYARLRDVTLSYTFSPSVVKRLKMSSLSVFAKANNYFTWVRDHDNLRIDPEAGQNGYVNGTVPKNKSITIGVNIGL